MSMQAAIKSLRDAPCWLFDLDNTLYPCTANLFDEMDRRMTRFVADFLKIGAAEAYKIQKSYFRAHGTTLKGLMDLHGMAPGVYLDYVHDIDMSRLKRDLRLDTALSRLPGRKIIFTNATVSYAERVLEKIGIARHFEGIYDIEAANYVPKPDPSIYGDLVKRFGVVPGDAVMVEDVARNLIPAQALGMTTVWVETDRPWAKADAEQIIADHRTDDLGGFLAEITTDPRAD
jgi:putative hydrolase of the HAD superfamily